MQEGFVVRGGGDTANMKVPEQVQRPGRLTWDSHCSPVRGRLCKQAAGLGVGVTSIAVFPKKQ